MDGRADGWMDGWIGRQAGRQIATKLPQRLLQILPAEEVSSPHRSVDSFSLSYLAGKTDRRVVAYFRPRGIMGDVLMSPSHWWTMVSPGPRRSGIGLGLVSGWSVGFGDVGENG